MIARYSYSGLTWVDIEAPTPEEVSHLVEEFDLPPLVGDEIVGSTLRSKVDLYDNLIYIILHFPVPSKADETTIEDQEVDFILGKDFIITVHYERIDPIHQFAGIFEKSSLHSRGRHPHSHSGHVFIEMMRQFYHHLLQDFEAIGKDIQCIEACTFGGQEEKMVREISRTGRRLLDFKQTIRFHEDVLRSYEAASEEFFGEKYKHYATLATAEFNKVNNLLESYRDMLAELQRTNDSLLSTKQNSIMKKFTIISFVTFPLMLVTGIFGMNTIEELIFIRSNSDFFFVIGAMVLTSFTMFAFFKFQKWL